jgi:transglutaminase-like putative cysteine protease
MSSYTLEQQIRYEYQAPVANLRQRLMVVPPARHGGQRRRSWSLDVEGPAPVRARSRTDRFGNHALTVAADHVPDWIEFRVSTEVEVDERRAAHRAAAGPRDIAFTVLTAPDDLVVALAKDTGPDPGAICRRVHAAFSYEYGVTGVSTTAAEALAVGRGVCQDYAHVMLSVCRLAGIPARYVSGHLLGEGGSHAWVEVLRPARGSHWVAEGWDPTHDRRTGSGYVTVATGRDYADVAPLSGTYDGVGVTGTLSVSKRVCRTGNGTGAATATQRSSSRDRRETRLPYGQDRQLIST